jgi:hypothetical protein
MVLSFKTWFSSSKGSRNRRGGARDLTLDTGNDFLNHIFSQPNLDDLASNIPETVSYDNDEIGKMSLRQLGLEEEETSSANSASGKQP